MASDLGQTYLDARVAATEADDEARWQQRVGPPKLNVAPLPEVPGPPVPGEPAPTMGLTITPQGPLAQGVPGLVEETRQPGLDFEEQRGRLYDILGRERPQPLSAQVPQSGIPPQYVPENLDWIEGAMSNIHTMTPGGPAGKPTPPPRTLPKQHPLVTGAIEHFGLTTNPVEAGYVLADGRMLDLSGKAQGGQPGMRALDHREISFAFPDDYPMPKTPEGQWSAHSSMSEFMQQTGAIRWGLIEGGELYLGIEAPLSVAQKQMILRHGAKAEGISIDALGQGNQYFELPAQRREFRAFVDKLPVQETLLGKATRPLRGEEGSVQMPGGAKPLPEAQAATELLAGPSPEAATRMNMARFSAEQRQSGILELINQLNVEAGTVEAVATPITHAETIAASRGAITAEQLFSKPKGFLIADVEPRLQVVEADRILVRSERRLVDLAKRTAAGDTTAADLLPDALAVHSHLDAAVVDMGEIMGRGLEARKQVAEIHQPSALRVEAVRELADRLRLGGAAPTTPPGPVAQPPGPVAQPPGPVAQAPSAVAQPPGPVAQPPGPVAQAPSTVAQAAQAPGPVAQAVQPPGPTIQAALQAQVQTLATAQPPAITPTTLAQMILSNQTLAGGTGVNTFVRGAAQAKGITFTDMVYEAWINGLLSNPESHGRNIANGLLQAVTGVPVRAIARTMEPGTEGVVAGEASAMAYAYLAHSFDMWKMGLQSWRANQSQFALPTKSPIQPAISGLGLESASGGALSATGWLGRGMDLFGWLVRQPGRGMMAADDMLKYANYRAELHALAVRDGVQQGLSGQTLSTHIAATVANPPASVHQLAMDYAAYSTYARDKGPIASWLSDPRVEPVMKWLNPFVRVQDNINRVSFEMVPGLNLAVKSVREDLAAGGARADLSMAKMSLGSLLMAGAAGIAASGELTGAGPRDPAQRAVWLRTHQPYSFKFPGGDTWYSHKWMGPLSMALAIPATMIEMGESLPRASWDQLAMGAILATGEMLLDPTWSTGLSNVMAAIREPETKGLRYLTTFASSFVPGFVGEIEKLVSPTRAQPYPSPAWVGHYDVRGEHVWKGVDDLLAAVAARVPGWSDKLPPSLDVWGNPRMQSFGVQAVSDDPVDQELLRLGIGLQPPSSTIAGPADPSSPFVEQDRPGSGIPLRPWEYHDYVKLAGNDLKLPSELGHLGLHDALAKLITTEYYQKSLTDGRDGTKADTIKSLASKYRRGAEAYLYTHNDSLRGLVEQRKRERQAVKTPEPLRQGLAISR